MGMFLTLAAFAGGYVTGAKVGDRPMVNAKNAMKDVRAWATSLPGSTRTGLPGVSSAAMDARMVREVMSTPVESVKLETPLREAAKKMQRKDIGDVLVLNKTGQVQGIVTDRDLAIRSVAEERDPNTPVEETMEALHDVVKAGKARYLGASSMWAWQFSKMQYTADLHGWTRFVSMQNQYNLMQREEEREMFGVLADQGVGSIPYAPLAKGRLARPWGEHSKRSDVDPIGRRFDIEGDKPIVEAVRKVAEARGIPMAHVALAWVLKNPVVTAPIVGPTKPHHLPDSVAALDVQLTDEEIRMLEEPYGPHVPTGFV